VPFVPAVTVPSASSSSSRWFVVHPKGIVLHGGEPPDSGFLRPDHVDALGLDRSTSHYLGRHDDEDCFVIGIDFAPEGPFLVENLYALFGRLSDEELAIASRAVQVAGWAETHRFCGRCGATTERDLLERCLRCPRCALVVYPRISPAIIVLVRRGDEALLARSGRFPVPFYSTLAGFVEAGESLEETLHREVREEVGIEVDRLRYFGSQSWPFPNSLMVGYFAEYAGGEIVVDGEEIADAQWFAHDALPKVPPRHSIARSLIDAWVAEVRSR
jgi:NAD+ diphosphatase